MGNPFWTPSRAPAVLLPSEEYHDLATLVRAKARKNGERPAFRFANGGFNYTELDRASDRLSAGLAEAGIAKGDRIAALLYNCPEFLELWFGAAKLGAVLVPINNGLKGEILRYELADSDPKGIVLDPRLWGAYEPARAVLPGFREWFVDPPDGTASLPGRVAPFADLRSSNPPPSMEAPKPWEPAAILYTSGTTGPPKGAIIPHQKLISTPQEIGRAQPARRALGPLHGPPALPLQRPGDDGAHRDAQRPPRRLRRALPRLDLLGDRRARSGATHVSLLISMVDRPVQATREADRPRPTGFASR